MISGVLHDIWIILAREQPLIKINHTKLPSRTLHICHNKVTFIVNESEYKSTIVIGKSLIIYHFVNTYTVLTPHVLPSIGRTRL